MLNVEEVNKIIKDLEVEIGKVLEEMKKRPDDSRELFYSGLDCVLDHVFLKTATSLYYLVESHSVSASHIYFQESLEAGLLKTAKKPASSKDKLIEDPKGLEDYKFNLAIFKVACSQLKVAMKKMPIGGGIDKEYFDIRKSYAQFLGQVESFIEYAMYLKAQEKLKGDDKYLKILMRTLDTMQSLLRDSTKAFDGGWGTYKDEYLEIFEQAKSFFEVCSGSLVKTARNILEDEKKNMNESDKKGEEKPQVEEKKLVQPALSLVERRRLEIIKTANELYDEFVNGTIVDLKNQTPYSVRKEYFELIQIFEDFCKKFKMPLAESTGFNKAEKAKMQLEKLFEKVSQLSQNATTTNIYMMKE